MLKKSGGEYTYSTSTRLEKRSKSLLLARYFLTLFLYLQHTFGNRLAYVLVILYVLVTRPVGAAMVAITFADYSACSNLECRLSPG